MNTEYQNIIIVGYGKVAIKILAYVMERQKDYGYQMEFIEHEEGPYHITKKICEEGNISFMQIKEKTMLKIYLDTLCKKTLIISAGNNYIFSNSLIEKENITIINFHNALLPNYPGRNAPSWAIYMGEKETGITWHYITENVDGGNIIFQKRCNIGEDIRAYELAGNLVELAHDGFIEVFDNILEEKCGNGTEQFINQSRKIYLSNEIPSNGVFDLNDSPLYIYRLLRSIDYGNSNIFPKPRTYYRGEEIEILRFRKIDKNLATSGDSILYLPLKDSNVLKMKYKKTGR